MIVVSILIGAFSIDLLLDEILLFVLVGTQIDISLAFETAYQRVLLIVTALLIRASGVVISLIRTNLNFKEKVFCIVAYISKAAVQAAIGLVPLSIGVEYKDIIFSLAALFIIITTPLEAIAIKYSIEKLLLPITRKKSTIKQDIINKA